MAEFGFNKTQLEKINPTLFFLKSALAKNKYLYLKLQLTTR